MEMSKIFKEIKKLEEDLNRKQPAGITCTVKEPNGEEIVYEGDFLLIHVGESKGSAIGQLSVEQLLQCVEIVLDSTHHVLKRLPMDEQVYLSNLLLTKLMRRAENE